MKHGSLFSGIGGFDLAAEWMGWENVFHCENNEFCQKILKHHFPSAISFGDIKTLSIESIWQEFVLNVKNQYALQTDHIVSHVITKECRNGEQKIETRHSVIQESGIEERKKKSLNITEGDVFVVENIKWNFSQLTIKKIMAMQNGENINLRHGNLLLNVDSLMTTKSSVTIAIMQNLIMEFVHIIKKYEVDIITGGFPCQPFSVAGKRKGTDDDRYLWKEMLRAIREIQPSWVVGENVPGLLNWKRGMVLAEIKADLESSGFEVFPPCILPACGKNAPHRRDRLWIVAYSRISGTWANAGWFDESRKLFQKAEWEEDKQFGKPVSQSGTTPNSNGFGLQREQDNGNFGSIGIPPTWENFPTQSPVCGGNDGVQNRVDRIKALGNSVVPQVVYEIFKAIESCN